jgi:hypothetical protein
MGNRKQASQPVESGDLVVVTLGRWRRLAGVERHPHPQLSRLRLWTRGELVLRGNGSGKGSRGRWKRGLNGIPNVVIEVPTVGRDSGLQQGIMPRHRGTHLYRIALPEPGAAGDVGEEKGHAA